MALILFLQAAQIVEPYTFREDEGQTTKVILKNGLTVIVREQQAVPLASVTTYVKAGYFDEDDRLTVVGGAHEAYYQQAYIAATLLVERDSQKGIVIGEGGKMLKQIGMKARQEIEAMGGRDSPAK